MALWFVDIDMYVLLWPHLIEIIPILLKSYEKTWGKQPREWGVCRINWGKDTGWKSRHTHALDVRSTRTSAFQSIFYANIPQINAQCLVPRCIVLTWEGFYYKSEMFPVLRLEFPLTLSGESEETPRKCRGPDNVLHFTTVNLDTFPYYLMICVCCVWGYVCACVLSWNASGPPQCFHMKNGNENYTYGVF